MGDISISLSTVLSICAAVTAVWGVYKIYKELKKPNDDLRAQVQANTKHIANDNERIKDVEIYSNMICRCLLVQLDHQITGNGIDKLKKMRTELNDYLVNR